MLVAVVRSSDLVCRYVVFNKWSCQSSKYRSSKIYKSNFIKATKMLSLYYLLIFFSFRTHTHTRWQNGQVPLPIIIFQININLNGHTAKANSYLHLDLLFFRNWPFSSPPDVYNSTQAYTHVSMCLFVLKVVYFMWLSLFSIQFFITQYLSNSRFFFLFRRIADASTIRATRIDASCKH